MNWLLTFHTVSAALMLQKVLQKRQGASCEVVPVPRSLSSSCGYAVLAGGLAAGALVAEMAAHGIEWAGLYRCEDAGGQEHYVEVAASDRESQVP